MSTSAGTRFDSLELNKDVTDEDTEAELEIEKPEELKRDGDKEAEPEQLLKRKRVRMDKPFSEDMLASENGLQRIYEEFPKIYKCGGRGSEARNLKKLTAMYKEWAFQLHRGVAFSDLLMRTETFGSKGKIRSTLGVMRERERERYMDILAKDLPPLPVVTTHPLPVESPADSPGGARVDVGTPGSVSSSAGPGDTPSSAYAITKAVEAGEHAAQKEGEEGMMSGTTAVSNTSPSPSQKRTVTDMFGDEVSFSPQQIEQAEKERAQAEVELGALEGEDSSPLLASTSAAPADAVLSSLEQ